MCTMDIVIIPVTGQIYGMTVEIEPSPQSPIIFYFFFFYLQLGYETPTTSQTSTYAAIQLRISPMVPCKHHIGEGSNGAM